MRAEIITIGDEILIGQIVDTNAVFISKELNKIGVSVYQITSIQDDKQHILNALNEAASRVDLVLITGGLGPTKDDITKHTLCTYFNDVLIEDSTVLAHITSLFKKYINAPMTAVHRTQAQVLSKATVLKNSFGTAPGMWVEQDGTVFVSMPGVPFEMKEIVKEQLLPKIVERFKRPYIVHRTVVTYGMGESAVAERIEDWENALPRHIKLAYLPSLGKVRLRLSARGEDEVMVLADVQKELDALYLLIPDIIFGMEDDEPLEVTISKLLTEKGKTLATAESCTGGKIAAQCTAISGASAYFKGSVVAYATEVKTNVLGVSKSLIKTHSVVSEPVASAMAVGIQKLMNTDFAIATTGNAGPSKGDADADVGTVCIAVASPTGVYAQTFTMGNHRNRVIEKTVNKAFELLQKEIVKF